MIFFQIEVKIKFDSISQKKFDMFEDLSRKNNHQRFYKFILLLYFTLIETYRHFQPISP